MEDTNNNIEKEENEDGETHKVAYRLRSGQMRMFNVSKKACEPFGFFFGERVKVRGGKKAWVVGVWKGEGNRKNLYFHIDGDKGASYYSDYLKEDFIRENFELISPRLTVKTRETFSSPAFKTLLQDEQFSDVAFNIGGTIIKAHKNILVARCDYFRAMFKSGMKEHNEEVITIPDIDEATFRGVLEFLYTGKTEVTSKNIVSLLTAAERFQIIDLKDLCRFYFGDVVTEENVIQLLTIADSCNEQVIKTKCKKYILSHYDTIIKTEDFQSLISAESRNLLLEIMTELKPPRPPKKRKIESPNGSTGTGTSGDVIMM